MSFNALIVDKAEDGTILQAIQEIGEERLPAEGDVSVAVEYSTVNYKDGLCLTGAGGLVRNYPHVPGIDFAGTVETSGDARYKPGDKVVLTGWRVGEAACRHRFSLRSRWRDRQRRQGFACQRVRAALDRQGLPRRLRACEPTSFRAL